MGGAFSNEVWDFPESNAQQQYATHSLIRYYGKLPPVVTKRILEESRRYLSVGPGIDIACGSGTTLVEAMLIGLDFEGIDVNPLSVLATRVKTNPPSPAEIDRAWNTFSAWVEIEMMSKIAQIIPKDKLYLPTFRGRDEWFTQEAQEELALLIQGVRSLPEGSIQDFFMLMVASVIRKASNASDRTGRIFKQVGKEPVRPWLLLQKKVLRIRPIIADFYHQINGRARPCVSIGDAKNTRLENGKYGLVFFHPPYFALYKYSSDVLRFELEWLEYDRKKIVKDEIRDGFKTTRIEDVEPFLQDIGAVLREGRRIVHSQGAMVVISNNSTLRKQELPVIEGIKKEADLAGFHLSRHCVRTVRYAQASYHRSADEEINTPHDHILFFEPLL